jgi:hypothetical protein
MLLRAIHACTYIHAHTYTHGNVGLQTAGACSTHYTIVLHARYLERT